MKLPMSVANALNAQVNAELTASYHYLAMSAYFEGQSLPGFAAWFRAQSAEETVHGMKIYDYIQRRDADVTLTDISASTLKFQSAEDVVSTALKMEQAVTAQIHEIHTLATTENDPATQALMHWFLDEQIEEEESMRDLLERVAAAGDDRWRLLYLDGEIAGRAEPAA